MTDARPEIDAAVAAAEKLVPLLRDTAREAEMARRPLDRVIGAVRDSGLYSLMVPKKYGGQELDLDTFFEVVLRLSRADGSMGWLTGFYIEHNLWVFNYPERVVEVVLDGADHVLAPAALSMGGWHRNEGCWWVSVERSLAVGNRHRPRDVGAGRRHRCGRVRDTGADVLLASCR